MQKRRQRIEQWRAERKKREQDAIKKEAQKGTPVTEVPRESTKKWSLEDESDEEDKEKDTDTTEKIEEEGVEEEKKEEIKEEVAPPEKEDEDPLDAFMQS